MTRFGWLAAGGMVIAILGVVLLVWGFSRQSASYETSRDTMERSTVTDPAALSIYTSGTYGFSFFYPMAAVIEDTFTESAFPWHSGIIAPGTLIVRIIAGASEARIGASNDEDAVASCDEAGSSEQGLEPLTVGTTSWSVFTYDQLGTENQRRVTSYRTVHEGSCFAVETFEPLGGEGTPQDISLVVRSFTFAR